jgi:hypothetical protein
MTPRARSRNFTCINMCSYSSEKIYKIHAMILFFSKIYMRRTKLLDLYIRFAKKNRVRVLLHLRLILNLNHKL